MLPTQDDMKPAQLSIRSLIPHHQDDNLKHYATSTSEQDGWIKWIGQRFYDSSSNQKVNPRTSSSPSDIVAFVDRHPTSLAFISGSLFAGTLIWMTKYGYRAYFRRIPNSDYVTPKLLRRPLDSTSQGLSIKGFVTSVGDADNFRLYHTPGLGWSIFRRVPKQKSALKDQTIHIRLAGVDAPELAHFGQPEQPFSQEALRHLKKLVDHKTVKVRMLSKDRYNRIVGMVFVRRWWCSPFRRKNVSLAMVEAGLAAVYKSAGAEYGSIYRQLIAAEAKAKKNKLGMWSQKASKFESPRDYKLRHAKESSPS